MTYHLVITTYYLQLDIKYLLSTVNLRLSILYIGSVSRTYDLVYVVYTTLLMSL